MLSDTRKAKELKRFFDFLHALNRETDRLFSREIISLEPKIRDLVKKLEVTGELRRKLDLYKSQKFEIKSILEKRYSSYDQMAREVEMMLKELSDLQTIITDYNRIKRDLEDSDTLRQFEKIMYKPEQHKEIKSLWHKLKR